MSQPRRVSVLIPAYYSVATIGLCLEAIERQTFRDFEVRVVNSSPENETVRLVRERFPDVHFEQSLVRLYPHAARNRAAEGAGGELLVFTDPDCVPRADWLARLVAAVDAGHPVVVGAMDVARCTWLEAGAHLSKFWWLLPGLPEGPRAIAPTANACYTRAAWEAVGPFDGERFEGDAILSWKAANAGAPPWFEPRSVVAHHHGATLLGLCRERVARGGPYILARMAQERWSRVRAAVYLALQPVAVLWVLAQTGAAALRAGWGLRYLWTLPVQILGQAGWSLGESRTLSRWLLWGKR